MRKIAFFDFCRTLVKFHTADAFVDFVRETEGSFCMKLQDILLNVLFRTRIILILNKLIPGSGFSKRMKLLQLKGFKSDRLEKLAENFYTKEIKPNLISTIVDEMQRLSRNGYEICIVSAGYSIYLDYFARDFNIEHVIATDIAFNTKNNLCTGKISGKDCYNIEKVKMTKEYFRGQDVNYCESISYSDCISDLPLLLLSGQGVVVSEGTPQQWSNIYEFKEIIWD